jgi:glucokinase
VGRQPGPWQFESLETVPTVADIGPVLRQFLSRAGNPAIEMVACCGAGPVASDGRIHLTNADTVLDPDALARAAGAPRALLVNDFAAVARAIPALPPDAFQAMGAGTAQADAPALVIGPGTGLGVALLVPAGGRWVVVPGEGGHADLAPVDEEQARLWESLRTLHGRVSAETVLSGPGLERLYAVCVPGRTRRAPEITEAAWRGEVDAAHVVRIFTRWLGSFAGNLALTAGARGGLYLAGGIVPSWGGHFDRRLFRQAFEDKSPYGEWLRGIPSYVVMHPQPGLYGLAALAAERGFLTSPP